MWKLVLTCCFPHVLCVGCLRSARTRDTHQSMQILAICTHTHAVIRIAAIACSSTSRALCVCLPQGTHCMWRQRGKEEPVGNLESTSEHPSMSVSHDEVYAGQAHAVAPQNARLCPVTHTHTHGTCKACMCTDVRGQIRPIQTLNTRLHGAGLVARVWSLCRFHR
jgi:hypothetical protein